MVRKAEEAVKDCFDTTVWEEFCDSHGEDIDSLTNCITDYINFCVENIVPTRTVRCFSNNKPWINPDIKALLKEKKRAFKSGNKDELKAMQRLLRRKIREGENSHKRKMEDQLQQKNTIGVWRGLKTISGFKNPDSQAVRDQRWANDLNVFFNRFDQLSVPSPGPVLHAAAPRFCTQSSRPLLLPYLLLPLHNTWLTATPHCFAH